MKLIDLSNVGADVIFNSLYDDLNPELLMQDIAALKLHNGSFVDVSWYPQFDPAGAFTVSHYSSDYGTQLWYGRTRNPQRVLEFITYLVAGKHYQRPKAIDGGSEVCEQHSVNRPTCAGLTASRVDRSSLLYA